jgi:hypothetical protein
MKEASISYQTGSSGNFPYTWEGSIMGTCV